MARDRKKRGLAARLLGSAAGRARDGAANALEILRSGGLVEDHRAEFEVVERGPHHALRRYAGGEGGPAVLLVPPLMVTAEIYDISPELSAVAYLGRQGVDAWVVDFGRPEEEEGGMERTLDDHVLAVVSAIETVSGRVGGGVHLAGYSQGGLFCYQAAAYARSANVASVITFGSPVDLSRNLPVPVRDDIARRIMGAAGEALARPLDLIDGLPGALTSNGFKVLSMRKEVGQLADFARSLHDREALERREPRRRFLNGEGFVAWPGPALKQFVDELVTGNRMAQGGMVVAGESISLEDMTCPVLYFVGARDDLARPASVRSVRRLAPGAQIHERVVESGHFGLVVGSRAMGEVWPDVVAWARDVERGELAGWAEREGAPREPGRASLAAELWARLGEVGAQAADVVDTLRWTLPRVAQAGAIQDGVAAGPSRALRDGALATPERPFLLWSGRARTWAQAEAEVDALAAALSSRHEVGRGDRVGLVAGDHPEALLAFLALVRLGAIAVVAPRGVPLERVRELGVDLALCDAASYDACAEAFGRARVIDAPAHPEALRAGGARGPMEVGQAEDVCAVVFTAGGGGRRRPAIVTNRRWTLAALGAAAACAVTSRDTVWCGGGLDGAMGLLVASGAAMIAGARLALAPGFDPEGFWPGARRAGVTVVYAHGEVARALARVPRPKEHAVRAWCGVDLDASTRATLDALGVERVAHVYATTEAPLALANLGDAAPESVGHAPPGMHAHRIVRIDPRTLELARGDDGRLVRCGADEVGALVVRTAQDHPALRFDGFDGDVAPDVFTTPGGAYLNTGDLARANARGDVRVLGRAEDAITRGDGSWLTAGEALELLRGLEGVREVALWRDGDALRVALAGEATEEAVREVLGVEVEVSRREALPRDSAYRPDMVVLRG
jgi:putative long chain acyl-CoA synthase